GFPVATSYAASDPAVATMTRSPTTSGELAMPQSGIFLPVSDAALRDQTSKPSRSSSAFRIPVAPSVYTRPLLRVGVARGPAPAFDSQNLAASLCFHTGLPVFTS